MGAASASAYALLITRPPDGLGSKYANPIHRIPCLQKPLKQTGLQTRAVFFIVNLVGFKRQFHELCRHPGGVTAMSLRARRGAVVGSAETRDRENVLLDQFSPSGEGYECFAHHAMGFLKNSYSLLGYFLL